MRRAFFSIIRYVPDLFREEFLNIGAIAVFPGTEIPLKLKIVPRKTLAQKLSKTYDSSFILNFEETISFLSSQEKYRTFDPNSLNDIEVETNSLEFLNELCRMFSGTAIQLSEIRWSDFDATIITPEIAQTFLEDLIQFHVASKRLQARRSVNTLPSLKTTVRRIFREHDLIAISRSNVHEHKIVENYKIDNKIVLDFGLENRYLHLFEMLDLITVQGDLNKATKDSGEILMKFKIAEKKARYGEGIKATTILRVEPENKAEIKDQLEELTSVSNIIDVNESDAERKILQEIISN